MSAARSPAMKLDFDIIVAIMKSMEGDRFEGKNTISALSQTCKYLRREGVKSLLAHDLSLRGARVASICDFILADPTTRGPLLRTLDINFAIFPVTAVPSMVETLHYIPHLTSLKIRYFGQLPQSAALTLCAAFASLTCLKELVLSGLSYDRGAPAGSHNERFTRLLHDLQSPLTAIELGLPELCNGEEHVVYNRNRDPIFLLSKFRTTLERAALGGHVLLKESISVYPRVTWLCLPAWGMPFLRPLITSFPNVRHIEFRYYLTLRYPGYYLYMTENPCVGHTRREWHDLNVQYQSTRTWPRIDSLRATILDAYTYGISCSVSRMHLRTVGGAHSVELAMLSAIFADTRPSAVRLALKAWFGRNSLPMLPTCSPLAHCLTSLEIRVNVNMQVYDFGLCFHHVIKMVQSLLALSSFRLEFNCCNLEYMGGEKSVAAFEGWDDKEYKFMGGEYCPIPVGFGEHDLCHMRYAIEKLDLLEQVRAIAAASLTLRRVYLLWRRCHMPHRVDRPAPPPNRVVGIDLDNMPHFTDRLGDTSDVWCAGDW
ncbi:hypothetical protein C8T65DRAFT_726525 [Cerioporus squamosus]|nr:hypothetical protein C8T65DRAFT_726525 [Cerioporus squamosus]